MCLIETLKLIIVYRWKYSEFLKNCFFAIRFLRLHPQVLEEKSKFGLWTLEFYSNFRFCLRKITKSIKLGVRIWKIWVSATSPNSLRNEFKLILEIPLRGGSISLPVDFSIVKKLIEIIFQSFISQFNFFNKKKTNYSTLPNWKVPTKQQQNFKMTHIKNTWLHAAQFYFAAN